MQVFPLMIISLISSFSNFLTSSYLIRFFRLTAPAAMLGRLLSATSSIFHPNMQHPKFYIFSISSSRFHLYLLILSISFLRFHPYFFILDILTFPYNPPSFEALKLHPEQFHNGILRLVISFLLFHPYHFISPNISLLFHTIYFHLLYFIL